MTSYHEAMRMAMDVENRPGAECAHWLAVATELRQLFGDQIQARARVDFWSDRPAPEPPRDGDLRRTGRGQLQEWAADIWVDVDEPPAAPQAEADWWTREPLVDDAPVSPAHGEVHLSLGDRDPVNLGESTQVIRVPDMAAQMRVTDSATEITDRSAIRTCAWCTLSITYHVPASGNQAGWRHVRTGVAACADGVTLAWPGEPTPVE